MRIDKLNKSLRKELGPDALLEATDFRPHFDGFMINVCLPVRPGGTREETRASFWDALQGLALWLSENRKKFTEGDRFQIFTGWAEGVRDSGCQLIRWGGTMDETQDLLGYEDLDSFLSETGEAERFHGWDIGVEFQREA